jgi:hypothetical protein
MLFVSDLGPESFLQSCLKTHPTRLRDWRSPNMRLEHYRTSVSENNLWKVCFVFLGGLRMTIVAYSFHQEMQLPPFAIQLTFWVANRTFDTFCQKVRFRDGTARHSDTGPLAIPFPACVHCLAQQLAHAPRCSPCLLLPVLMQIHIH